MKKDEWYWGLSPLIRENIEEAERYEKAGGGLTPSIEEYYDGYIPEGCRACGGDCPRCRQGCALFDED